MIVNITESAQNYLQQLLEKQNVDGIGIRIFVSKPGTRQAETCITYCRPGEEQEDDKIVEYDLFSVYFERRSVPFLKDAQVDYSTDKMSGQLTIRAPNSRMPQVYDDSPIEDRINYVLYNEVNPGLASHGGQVELQEFTEEGYAVLKFGGGCQGCSAVNMTLKDGVEKTLMERISEIKGVRDITDHTNTVNSYY